MSILFVIWRNALCSIATRAKYLLRGMTDILGNLCAASVPSGSSNVIEGALERLVPSKNVQHASVCSLRRFRKVAS